MLRALILLATLLWPIGSGAQTVELQSLLQENRGAVEKASRKTVDAVLAAMIDSGLPEVPVFLEKWRNKEVWQRKEDGLFFFTETEDKKTYQLIDVSAGTVHLEPLRGSIEGEEDAALKARKVRLERLLTLRFDEDEAARVTAIEGFKGDLVMRLTGCWFRRSLHHQRLARRMSKRLWLPISWTGRLLA